MAVTPPLGVYRLAIFDLDGTLVDSLGDLAASVNHVRRMCGMDDIDIGVVKTYVGSGVKTLVDRALPGLSEDKRREALKAFGEHYAKHLLDTTREYPGVREMLTRLDGRKLAVLTNKTEEFSVRILRQLGLDAHFSIVWGGDTGPEKKPSPAPIFEIMKRLDVTPEQTVMIGDGVNDVLSAKSAGVRAVALSYGYSAVGELAELNPEFIVPGVTELAALLDAHP